MMQRSRMPGILALAASAVLAASRPALGESTHIWPISHRGMGDLLEFGSSYPGQPTTETIKFDRSGGPARFVAKPGIELAPKDIFEVVSYTQGEWSQKGEGEITVRFTPKQPIEYTGLLIIRTNGDPS